MITRKTSKKAYNIRVAHKTIKRNVRSIEEEDSEVSGSDDYFLGSTESESESGLLS